jgi:hypothetical protein
VLGASRQPRRNLGQDSGVFDSGEGSCSGVPSDPCLTFAQARVLAVRHMEVHRPLAHGAHYAAAANGWHNATHWHVRVDEARYLQTGDQQYMLIGTPEVLVDKTTGEVTTLALLSAPALFSAMTSAREHPRHPGSRGNGDRMPSEGRAPRPVPVWLILAPPRPG